MVGRCQSTTIRNRGPACTVQSRSGGASDFDQHFAVFDLQRIHGNSCAGILLGCAGLWILSPAVPRANDLSAFDHSLPQRAAAMQADVVHGAIDAVHVGHADGLRAAGKFSGFVGGWECGFCGELCEVWHGLWRVLSRASLGGRAKAPVPTQFYFGCSVCAIITWRLKLSSIFGSRRTSVGFFASVMVSILSCSLSSA